MISAKLIALIEKHADSLIDNLTVELKNNSRTTMYKELNEDHLINRTKNVYNNLSSWLGEKSEDDIMSYYKRLGAERKGEKIPLSQVISALTITRNTLLRFIQNEIPSNTTLEIYQQMEFNIRITTFFDKAIYFTAKGFEEA